ncbi:hypothetical protein [Paraburkholderia caribensis]|uniref:hypothetical protein n=1 Tax=Paraburkholderia caribensis TaxID=75105 RepID=UPI001CB521F3|nr:hypothetical protein [Paraburkholderia caribensis]CAG9256285.1 exported hypothetical protein [Paraburkholderia caribensis]
MKKIFARMIAALVLLVAASSAQAQFTAGQTLTAAQLNAALAAPNITGGTITGLSSPIPIASGGTGATSATNARTNLGAASTGVNTFTGGQTQTLDFGEYRFRATSGSNLNGWRLTSTINGASDGTLVIQHSNDNFASNFISALTFSNAGVGTFASRPIFGSATPWDSANFTPPLSGTSSSIGGSALAAGACSSGTVSVAGSTTSMAVAAAPATYPGDGIFWHGYVSSAGTVTVKVCASVSATPTASAYNVRVIP